MKGKLTQVEATFLDEHKEMMPHIEDHYCDNCEQPFRRTYSPGQGGIQPDDTLRIEFTPYYGGYTDQSGLEDTLKSKIWHMFWFCETCANALIKQFPCLKVHR